MDLFLKFIAGLILSAGAFFLNLYTFVKMWTLIAVPMGAPKIDQWQAYGLMILVSHFITPMLYFYAKKEPDVKEAVNTLTKFSIYSATGSLVGWGLAYWIFG